MFLAAALQHWLSKEGVIAGAAIAGFADTHSAAVAVASLVATGKLSANEAVLPILASLTTNTITKVVLAVLSGNWQFISAIMPGLVLVILAAWLGATLTLGYFLTLISRQTKRQLQSILDHSWEVTYWRWLKNCGVAETRIHRLFATHNLRAKGCREAFRMNSTTAMVDSVPEYFIPVKIISKLKLLHLSLWSKLYYFSINKMNRLAFSHSEIV
jgi:hypothetical protein